MTQFSMRVTRKLRMDRNCPVCSSAGKTLLYRQDFNNTVIVPVDKYDVVCCRDCGFVFADKVPAQGDFDNYYAEMSKYEFSHCGGAAGEGYFDYYAKAAGFIIPHLKDNNAAILDIGCSTGGLLSVLRSSGYSRLMGVDPSATCAKTAKELYGLNVKACSIADFTTQEKFDLIILSAVIEHLVDFRSSLGKVRSLLKETGLLFIQVPDAERFVGYLHSPFQQFSFEHINYFTRFSLANLLSSSYFDPLELKQDEACLNMAREPIIFSVSAKSMNKRGIVKDGHGEERIREYIEASSRIDRETREKIRQGLAGKDKVIVWGVGTHTQRLLGSGLELSKINFFVDSNKNYHGKKLKGIVIKPPEEIKSDLPILISTSIYQGEIARQIREDLRLDNEIITLY